jgi:mono/diheme cytochrome c family protein
MKSLVLWGALSVVAIVPLVTFAFAEAGRRPAPPGPWDERVESHAAKMIAEGRRTFRFETFGSEAFWGDALRLHEAVVGAKNGGVGPGISPKQALALGLKVDMTALPTEVVQQIKAGKLSLDDPATTVALLKLDAVIGVRAFFREGGKATMGLTCAVCHSTVDDAFAPGIGNRLDGWANQDLDVGKIVLAAPNLKPILDLLQVDAATATKVLEAWGPGKYDAELNLDGKGFRPDGKTSAVLIPSAYGKAGVNEHTWGTGWGSTTYWNAYVANLQLYGQGTFFDPRLDDAEKYPVAARARMGHKSAKPDRVTPHLAALHFYQLAIPAPAPPPGSFDVPAARRGKDVFEGPANCASCHVPPLFTEPGWNAHTGAEIGIDEFHASRAPTGRYRTAPLAGLHARAKRGFYHDGRFPTFAAVVEHYDRHFKLGLEPAQKADLVEFLKSL